MTHEQFWMGIWKLVTIGFCVLVVSITSCTVHADYRISQEIQHGANPIAAQCAHSSNGINNSACGTVAAR